MILIKIGLSFDFLNNKVLELKNVLLLKKIFIVKNSKFSVPFNLCKLVGGWMVDCVMLLSEITLAIHWLVQNSSLCSNIVLLQMTLTVFTSKSLKDST